mgnify:CR=1 FL=1
MKVLIVEDNESRQEFLRELLSQYDLSFTTTSTGAIAFLEQKLFDVIFLRLQRYG